MFDVALHFGTLMAVFVYFGKDIVDIVRDLVGGRFGTENGRLGILVLAATIPAAVVGFFLKNVFEVAFSSLGIVALGFAITGVFLLVVSVSGRGKGVPPARLKIMQKSRSVLRGGEVAGREERFGFVNWKKFGFAKALLVGAAQIFSLFPGISRSGATLGSGLLLGLDEKHALKFSFLMSIPIIFGANILAIGSKTLPSELIWATLVSFVVGLGTIHLLYGYLLTNRKNLKWFALYALALAVVVGVLAVF